jgi:hypothetical protein
MMGSAGGSAVHASRVAEHAIVASARVEELEKVNGSRRES